MSKDLHDKEKKTLAATRASSRAISLSSSCLASSMVGIQQDSPPIIPIPIPTASTSSPTKSKSFASILREIKNPSVPDHQPLLPPSTYHGEPELKLSSDLIARFSEPFRLTLVGKFSHGRPTMERTRLVFSKLDLKGNFSVSHLDHKHLLIRLEHEGDFTRLWLKELLYVDSFPMRIFKWSASFRADVESSVVPVWISLPNLPLFMLNKQCLFSIGNLVGQPLTLDLATAELKRPSLAKICVQVDLLKKLPHRVHLDCGEELPPFWQEIVYEKLPKYCAHCMRLGHNVRDCKFANPSSEVHAQHETFPTKSAAGKSGVDSQAPPLNPPQIIQKRVGLLVPGS